MKMKCPSCGKGIMVEVHDDMHEKREMVETEKGEGKKRKRRYFLLTISVISFKASP